jgi:hypothetical protein
VESKEKAVARQRLSKHVPAATNTLATMEKLLDARRGACCIRYSICNEREVRDCFFPGLLVCNVNAQP